MCWVSPELFSLDTEAALDIIGEELASAQSLCDALTGIDIGSQLGHGIQSDVRLQG